MNIRNSAPIGAVALLFLAGTVAISQERPRSDDQNRSDSQDQRDREQDHQRHDRFDERDQQTTRDWYAQHRERPARGFRDEDRLSADDEARLREGAPLDRSFRRRTYSVPSDLSRNLPRAPRGYRYSVIGGHVVMVDGNRRVVSVIHLHDN